jgi:hypothetical protein
LQLSRCNSGRKTGDRFLSWNRKRPTKVLKTPSSQNAELPRYLGGNIETLGLGLLLGTVDSKWAGTLAKLKQINPCFGKILLQNMQKIQFVEGQEQGLISQIPG